ncbi:arylsulfatase A-like enzyme [Wenyingzhuangia heitensis]|uniref:Arylsulfatase A-like enzyme n=1 Tax=Wenyingzhuangia heitensis TaxID=1487859 RepID=A0ABX0UCY2_9FLAO|nr:sulfatase [Wenyingzhuangia heitensis]NIJ45326.1 arylsulfatase A-like enzyme [Wenyingzhuangia heitensis]
MKKIKIIFLLTFIFQYTYAQPKPNILFIAVDDLRPELGCYGSKEAITPNIDKLASQGVLFNNAYCQQAICGPSRASIMTGIRPENSGVFHNYIKFREANPNVITLPQNFINNGYQSVHYGKIFHHGDEDPSSWNRTALKTSQNSATKGGFALLENQNIKINDKKEMFAKYGNVAKYGLAMGPAYECADVPDNTYKDGQNTDLAIKTLNAMVKEKSAPFFLGLGFHKPHLNWVAPKKYWDLYNESSLQLPSQVTAPKNGATMGVPPSFELRVRSGIPKTEDFSPELERKLKHAYLACVSYVDAQIGRMLAALDASGERDNTIIVLWSDHGYHLGEMGHWGKATNYEIATRVPLIIATPNMSKKQKGTKTNALVELVDLYPTLCDLAAINVPITAEGKSFAPLLKKPTKKWKKAAFSVFPTPALREWGAYPIRPAMRETYFGPLLKEVEAKIKEQQKENWNRELFENNLMGFAMRTKKHRVVFWKDLKNEDQAPLFVELYNHKKDPLETKNIAKEQPKLVQKLYKQFQQRNK